MHSEPNSQELTELGPVKPSRAGPTLAKAVKNQYVYKLKAYSGYFCGLILAQIIALIFSFSGTEMGGSGTYTYHYYSAQIVVLFTEFWALIIAILLCTRQSKNESFALPGNRLSDCLSDISYMLTCCLFGGITSALAGVALRIPVYFGNQGILFLDGFYPDAGVIFTIFATTALYMLFFSAAGYLCGTLVRFSKAFFLIIPALIAGTIFLECNSPRSQTFFRICWDSVINAHSLTPFAVWVSTLSVLMLAIATILSNWVEVKK
jgi:hypothetical protein